MDTRTTRQLRRRIGVAVTLAGVAMTLGLAPVSATTAVDEFQMQAPTGWQRYLPHAFSMDKTITGAALAQSFVPRVDGKLSGIELFAYAVDSWNEPVVVELRTGGPQGDVLAYTTVPLNAIPKGFTADWMPVGFAEPVDVHKGQEITVVLPLLAATGAEAADQPLLYWGRRRGNAYAAADGWLGSRVAGPQTSDQAAWAKVPADYSFRTTIAPVPNTATVRDVTGSTRPSVPVSPLPLVLIAMLGMVGLVIGRQQVVRRAQAATAKAAAAAEALETDTPVEDDASPRVTTADFVRLTGGSAAPRFRTFRRGSRRS